MKRIIENTKRIIVFNFVSFDRVRGLRLFFGRKLKMVNYFKSGAQHIEYWSKTYQRSGCLHYLEFCYQHFYFKVEIILPKYWGLYVARNLGETF